jgi:hypothetical protein
MKSVPITIQNSCLMYSGGRVMLDLPREVSVACLLLILGESKAGAMAARLNNYRNSQR